MIYAKRNNMTHGCFCNVWRISTGILRINLGRWIGYGTYNKRFRLFIFQAIFYVSLGNYKISIGEFIWQDTYQFRDEHKFFQPLIYAVIFPTDMSHTFGMCSVTMRIERNIPEVYGSAGPYFSHPIPYPDGFYLYGRGFPGIYV